MTGNHAANRTLRKFAATVDEVAPLDSVGPARQLELIAAALEMTQRLAHAPFDLGRSSFRVPSSSMSMSMSTSHHGKVHFRNAIRRKGHDPQTKSGSTAQENRSDREERFEDREDHRVL